MYTQNVDELMHYGVLGMKWGVRRSAAQLAKARKTGNRNRHDRAVTTLNKHKNKINKKITKIDNKNDKLQTKRNKQIEESDVKAAKYARKAAKYERKAIGLFTTPKRSEKLLLKADKKLIKANVIKSKSRQTQALIDRNKVRKLNFEKGLGDIDRVLATNGSDFVKKYA